MQKNLKYIRGFIVLSGFEPLSWAPKAQRIDHYPTGLHVKACTYRLFFILNFFAVEVVKVAASRVIRDRCLGML